jgi:hypothetical protein
VHTDEYEISLSRELAVCKSTIKKIKESFVLLERKHGKTTEQFVREFDDGKLTDNQDEYRVWRDTYASLESWEKLERQYQEIFVKMKI